MAEKTPLPVYVAVPLDEVAQEQHLRTEKRRRHKKLAAIAFVVWLVVMAFKSFGSFGASHRTPCSHHKGMGHAGDNAVHTDDEKSYEVFQVAAPLRVYGVPVATQVLADNFVFANTMNGGYLEVEYVPPSVEFTHVTLQLNASTFGRQFDRLSHIYLGDAEIWRLSTAEPGHKNISFSFEKDVSLYSALFKESNTFKIILKNWVDEDYTGPITYFVQAMFYNVENYSPAVSFLDSFDPKVFPNAIMSLNSPSGYAWLPPRDEASVELPALPRNTTRVLLDIFASGNALEEFWYTHLADRNADRFKDVPVDDFGNYGPLRVVEVYVNGQRAGEALPFPIIYAGGFSPSLWSPIVGHAAYDAPSYHVDLTPFLPALWEQGTTVSLKVSNSAKEGHKDAIEEDWIVNANLLLWQVSDLEGSGSTEPGYYKRDTRTAVMFGPPKSFVQAVSSGYKLSNVASLTFNDETFNVKWEQKNGQSNGLTLGACGNASTVGHSSGAKSWLEINDERVWKEKLAYSIGIAQKVNSSDIHTIAIGQAYNADTPTEKVKVVVNGTSAFHFIGERHVKGEAATEVKYRQRYPVEFARHVRADKGEITFDRDECRDLNHYSLPSWAGDDDVYEVHHCKEMKRLWKSLWSCNEFEPLTDFEFDDIDTILNIENTDKMDEYEVRRPLPPRFVKDRNYGK